MGTSYFSIPAAILILMLSATHPNSCLAARKFLSSETDTDFIKTSCGATTYPDLCFTTFSSYAIEIQASPKILATKSLLLTLNTTRAASKTLSELSKSLAQGLKPREAAALRDCLEQVSDSVDEVKRSIGEMDETQGKSFAFRMSDIETWVSAALTNEDTCMDGFSESDTDGDGDVKAAVRSSIEKVAHLTSIALAFVNRYASTKS
ncbi:hypothetical protein PTKIN_Ptkin05aG0037600 [Pterospermum kingtungense]